MSTQTKIPYDWNTLDNKMIELYEQAIEQYIEENNTEDTYENELNEIYGEVEVCGTTFLAGSILREMDHIMFSCSMGDNEDRVRERAEEKISQDDFKEDALEILNMGDEV